MKLLEATVLPQDEAREKAVRISCLTTAMGSSGIQRNVLRTRGYRARPCQKKEKKGATIAARFILFITFFRAVPVGQHLDLRGSEE